LNRTKNHDCAVKLSNAARNHHLKLVTFGSAFTAEVNPAGFNYAPASAYNRLLGASHNGSSVLAKNPYVCGFARSVVFDMVDELNEQLASNVE
jgi:hypothetical protein